MTKVDLWRFCGNRYVGDDTRDSESYGQIFAKGYSFFAFTPKLLAQLKTKKERAKFYPGSKFLKRKFGSTEHLVLRVPEAFGLLFAWRLNRRLAARENDFANSRRRYETLAKQTHYHTKADLRILWGIQNGRCYYTGQILGESFELALFHKDHLKPLKQGGNDGPMNLALVTPKANFSKNGRSKRSFILRLRPTPAQIDEMRRVDRERQVHFRLVDRLEDNQCD